MESECLLIFEYFLTAISDTFYTIYTLMSALMLTNAKKTQELAMLLGTGRTLHQKQRFPLRISSVNVTKSEI